MPKLTDDRLARRAQRPTLGGDDGNHKANSAFVHV